MKRAAHRPELLDGPLDRDVLAGNLRDLERVNRWLGGVALSRRALAALLARSGVRARLAQPASHSEVLRLLDVGTGAADVPAGLIEWAARQGIGLSVVAVDAREEVIEYARDRIGERADLQLEVARGEELPYPAGSFDMAHTSLVLHHLEPGDATRLIAEMARVSRTGIIVNDLDRSPWSWLGAWLLSHLLTRNRYSRHDAALSVRRAYRPGQVVQLASRAGLVEVARVHGFLRHRYALAFAHAAGKGPAADAEA